MGKGEGLHFVSVLKTVQEILNDGRITAVGHLECLIMEHFWNQTSLLWLLSLRPTYLQEEKYDKNLFNYCNMDPGSTPIIPWNMRCLQDTLHPTYLKKSLWPDFPAYSNDPGSILKYFLVKFGLKIFHKTSILLINNLQDRKKEDTFIQWFDFPQTFLGLIECSFY